MDNIFLIAGAAIVLVSIIMILKLKSKGSENDGSADVFREESEDELDLTEEEIMFIDGLSSGEPEDEEYEEYVHYMDDEIEKAEDIEEKEDEYETEDYRDAVVIMYKEGLSPNEIAKKLQLGKREVEIILKVKGLLK
jgi:DNA-directed RNA polymerase specialized sigma24 family protein